MVKDIDGLTLSGGRLCLDFINTVHSYKDGVNDDYWKDGASLIAWGRKLQLLTPKTVRSLHEAVRKREAAALRQARDLRTLLYEIFSRLALDSAPHQKNLDAFYNLYQQALTHQKMGFLQNDIKESWKIEGDDLQLLFAPVLKDAYELLTSHQLPRIGECPTCGWLFFDSSKNGKRRWCSMSACGSNAKALQWYYRKKGS